MGAVVTLSDLENHPSVFIIQRGSPCLYQIIMGSVLLHSHLKLSCSWPWTVQLLMLGVDSPMIHQSLSLACLRPSRLRDVGELKAAVCQFLRPFSFRYTVLRWAIWPSLILEQGSIMTFPSKPKGSRKDWCPGNICRALGPCQEVVPCSFVSLTQISQIM